MSSKLGKIFLLQFCQICNNGQMEGPWARENEGTKKLFMVSQIKSLSQCNLSDGIRDVTEGQGLGISPGYYEHDSQKIDPQNTLGTVYKEGG